MFTIIQDTREQIPLDFSFFEQCDGVLVDCVKTGDYSMVGYEDKVFIERKRSSGELSINLGVDKDRFYRELERARDIKWKYIVCEFSVNDLLEFPKKSGIPKNRWSKLRFNGKALYGLCRKIEEEYGIQFIFCINREEAAEEIIKIFTQVYESDNVGF